jgi:iron(III) transport system substrate-binding protein
MKSFNSREFLYLVSLSLLIFLAECNSPETVPQQDSNLQSAITNQPAGWEAEWKRLIENARKEGVVVVKGNPDDALRNDFTRAFKNRFAVNVEYLGTSSSEFIVKIERERAASIYSTDVVIGGSALYDSFYHNSWLDLMPSVLMYSDAIDLSKWLECRFWFADPDQRYLLRLASTVVGNVFINTNFVKDRDLKSWNDLLRPEFATKIISDDPEQQRTGHTLATMLYVRLGEPYVKRLYLGQKVTFVRDQRQLADALAHGSYSIALGMSENEYRHLREDHFPVAMASDLRELSGTVSPNASLVGLIKNAPHSNAAKLFVNWVAMKEGSQAFGDAAGMVPVRTDVDKSSFPSYLIPQPGREYFDVSEYEFATKTRLPAGVRVRQLIGQRE